MGIPNILEGLIATRAQYYSYKYLSYASITLVVSEVLIWRTNKNEEPVARTAKAKTRSPERYASARRTKAQRASSGKTRARSPKLDASARKMKARSPELDVFELEDKG